MSSNFREGWLVRLFVSWRSKWLPQRHLGRSTFKRREPFGSPYLDDVDPDLAEEMQLLLESRGFERLATAVLDLRLIEAREAKDPESISFRTVGRRGTGRFRDNRREIVTLRESPLLSVDVVRDRIVAINVFARPQLISALGPSQAGLAGNAFTDPRNDA